jgi:hypothetical protein
MGCDNEISDRDLDVEDYLVNYSVINFMQILNSFSPDI